MIHTIQEMLQILKDKALKNYDYIWNAKKKITTKKEGTPTPLSFHLCHTPKTTDDEDCCSREYFEYKPFIRNLDKEDLQYFIDKYCSKEKIAKERSDRISTQADIIKKIEKEYESFGL